MFGLLLNRQKLLTDAKRLGRWGEYRCEKFLRQKGFKTLTRNFSCKAGEIDLVMADPQGAVVFVEVKTRADELFGPAELVITLAKKQKMAQTARYFISEHNLHSRPCRFDIVAIVLGQKGKPQIRHYQNAFVP